MLRRSVISSWICAFLVIMAAGAAAPAAIVSRGTSEPVPSRAVRAKAEPCVWLFFIDDLHLTFTATGRLKNLLTTVFGQLVEDGDIVGVVSTGPSSIAIDLTRDRGRLAEAVDKFSGAGLKPSEIVAGGPYGDSSEIRYRAHVAFLTAYNVMKMLTAVRSPRQAFIYISNGYYVDIWTGGVRVGKVNPFTLEQKPSSLEPPKIDEGRLRDEAAELCAQASRAHVPIYTIDPRALSGPPAVDPNLDEAAWQRYWTTTRNSLRVLAEQTGGFLIDEELGAGLKRVTAAKGR